MPSEFTAAAALAPLFEPFEGGGLSLKNRIVMSPMTRWRSTNQYPGPEVAGYYRRRAENEVGLIITEGTTVDHPVSSYSNRVPAFHGAALDGWRRVVGEVHEAGGKIVPQLWHVGIMRDPAMGRYPNPDMPSASPSGVAVPGGQQMFEPMDQAEIQAVYDSFARAAVDARALGFDGLEIHGGHGYIIDQFLWDRLNLRTDEYGGDVEGRTRFARELVGHARAAVGEDFPIIFRFSQWKQQDYDARLADTPETLGDILRSIADAGADILHVSQRRYWDREFEDSDLNGAGWAKKLTGLPAITVGSVGLSTGLSVTDLGEHSAVQTDLAPLAARLATQEFDLVAVGRALLVDPAWAVKVREGRFGELLPFTKEALKTLS